MYSANIYCSSAMSLNTGDTVRHDAQAQYLLFSGNGQAEVKRSYRFYRKGSAGGCE